MKIAISYPPLEKIKGTPMIGQNRQYQTFSSCTYIYPIVPAYAATLLKKRGYQLFWDDGIAEKLSYPEWKKRIFKEKPDLIAIETKTPTVKHHWKIIDELKKKSLEIGNWKLEITLMGDHVTSLPKESLENSSVDYILTGGDYDFMLLDLANHLSKGKKLGPGFWFRENGKIKNTGPFQLNHDLDSLPFIDRDLTKWRLYAYENGNFSRTPGTYMMSGRDCWWGKCTFCSWNHILFPAREYRTRNPELAVEEVGRLINLGVREIMEDSGTLPTGEWLQNFCQGMIKKGYNKKVVLDCNLRFDAVDYEGYQLMRKAGFRFLLFGLESASQKTLDRINKNMIVEKIINSCQKAARARLSPHLTIMFGYPWEKEGDARATIKLGHYLLRKGYAKTLQATIVIPYPGTPLFLECKKRGWLKTLDWNRYDMRESIMKNAIPSKKLQDLVQKTYRVAFNPEFIFRQVISIRNLDDLRYFGRGAKAVIGHLTDFKKTKT